jgi:hypothetical protein
MGGYTIRKIYLTVVLCTLVLCGTYLAGAITCEQNVGPLDVKDQFQERSDECKWFGPSAWQEFQPVGKKHLHVEVKIKQGYEQSPPLKMTLEQPLGTVLTGVDVPVSDIPNVCDWVDFDFPNVDVDVANTAYIVLTYAEGGEYAWCGANGDLYPAGMSSEGGQWDWCFRTYVDKSLAKPYQSAPFNNIVGSNTFIGRLLSHTLIGQILTKILI